PVESVAPAPQPAPGNDIGALAAQAKRETQVASSRASPPSPSPLPTETQAQHAAYAREHRWKLRAAAGVLALMTTLVVVRLSHQEGSQGEEVPATKEPAPVEPSSEGSGAVAEPAPVQAPLTVALPNSPSNDALGPRSTPPEQQGPPRASDNAAAKATAI